LNLGDAIGCPVMTVTKYQSKLRYIPEERRCQPFAGLAVISSELLERSALL
jgi:hypothetical protein